MRLLLIPFVLLACTQNKAQVIATIHDHTVAAGTRVGDTVSVSLTLVRAMWYPETTADPGAEVWAIAADGGTPMIPGPLLRGTSNTVFRVTITNPHPDSTMYALGFGTRPGGGDSIRVAPKSDTTITFSAGEPGTYFYYFSWAVGPDETILPDEALLAGALIVDPPTGATPDRIFLASSWLRDIDSTLGEPFVTRDWLVINGRSYPHNGTIEMQQGDTLRWRWINASQDAHPIHLHGDHFRVTRIGDMTVDRDHWNQEVVTQLMVPGATFTGVYIPTDPGNWVVHCHFTFHTSHFLSADRVPEPADPGAVETVDHSVHGMKGMLIAIKVAPRPGGTRRPGEDSTATPIRIVAQGRAGAYGGTKEGMGYILTKGTEPTADSVAIPSDMLVLRRGESVAITVVNRLRAPTAVHWHGLELPSWSDGVPGWSGGLPDVAPAIAVGDSFTARFTPPRAGTFIYHAHSNEMYQIGSGLYGALLVVDPVTYRPDHERVVVVGGDGYFSATARVNGSTTPAPIVIPPGVPIRFRLVSIHIDYRISMQLLRDSTPMPWRMVAKDGADLPTVRQLTNTLPWISGPGETADYEVLVRDPGEYTLMVKHTLGEWAVPVRLVVSRGS